MSEFPYLTREATLSPAVAGALPKGEPFEDAALQGSSSRSPLGRYKIRDTKIQDRLVLLVTV
jgi:hypothetical protein